MKRFILLLLTMVLIIIVGCSNKEQKPYLPEAQDDKIYTTIGCERDYDVIIIPWDRAKPEVYGDGYAGRVEKIEKAYKIIMLER